MAMFTLAMSCLTTSNLPWFMDLTFQVPMQYCSLQHQTWLSPPDTSTTGHHFHFGSASSFFLELKEHSLNILSWAISLLFPNSILDTYLTWEAHLSLSYLFCFFILFMGFSRQEYWSVLPFSFLVDHVLSEFSTMTCLSWVALHGMAYSFTELDKAVVHVISLISFLWLWFSFCLPSEG